MRKLLGLLLVLGLAITAAYAVNPTTCVLTVTPGVTYSVSVDTANVTRDFGTVNLNSNKGIWLGTATNNGNATADIDGKGSNADGVVDWTIGTSQGTDAYQLQLASGDYGPVGSSTATFTDTNTQLEVSGNMRLAANTSFGLWVKILTPSTITGGTDVHTITLSIYARLTD